MTATMLGGSALPPSLVGVGSQFAFSPRPALLGVHSRWTPPRLQDRIRLPASLPEVPQQHAFSAVAAPGGLGIPGEGWVLGP